MLHSPQSAISALPSAEGNALETAKTAIKVKFFIDIYFDTLGWYALGHHEPESFLRAIAALDSSIHYLPEQVEHTWGRILGKDLEITGSPGHDNQPITLVEDFSY